MFSTSKIVSEIESLSARIESLISETGYDHPWWHIYPLMEKERRLISLHLNIVKSNEAIKVFLEYIHVFTVLIAGIFIGFAVIFFLLWIVRLAFSF